MVVLDRIPSPSVCVALVARRDRRVDVFRTLTRRLRVERVRGGGADGGAWCTHHATRLQLLRHAATHTGWKLEGGVGLGARDAPEETRARRIASVGTMHSRVRAGGGRGGNRGWADAAFAHPAIGEPADEDQPSPGRTSGTGRERIGGIVAGR